MNEEKKAWINKLIELGKSVLATDTDAAYAEFVTKSVDELLETSPEP